MINKITVYMKQGLLDLLKGLHNLTQEKVKTTEPTQGVNIKTIIQEGFTINVWDIGGLTSILERQL